MKILSSFSDPHVVANLYDLLYPVEHKRRTFEECPSRSFPYNCNEWGHRKWHHNGLTIVVHIIYALYSRSHDSSGGKKIKTADL